MDPLEAELDIVEAGTQPLGHIPITTIEPSDAWSNWRDGLANQMFNEFRG